MQTQELPEQWDLVNQIIIGGNDYVLGATQDVEPYLDSNKALQNEIGKGFSPSGDLRYVGELPMIFIHKWLIEEGWFALDPNCAGKLAQKLNDPDFRHLRTGLGWVGKR